MQVLPEETLLLNVKLSLADEEGVFLETEPIKKLLETPADSADFERKLIEAEAKSVHLAEELDAVHKELAKQEEVAQLQEERRYTCKTDSGEVSKLKQAADILTAEQEDR